MSYGDYPRLEGIKKILVIKLRHLGDVLLTTPVVSALKKRFEGAEIDAYIYKEAAPMLEGHPGISNLILYDREWKRQGFFLKMAKEAKILSQLRKKKYDLVINLTEGDRGTIASKVTSARVRVGFDTDKKKRKFYTHLTKVCHGNRHTVERSLDPLRRIGIFPEEDERDLTFHIPNSAEKNVLDLLSRKWPVIGRYILIHPTSRWRFKCWPAKKMHFLLKRLLNEEERVVIVSGKDVFEKEMVDEIVSGLDGNNLLNLSGAVNLKELGALIDHSSAMLCVDSVSFHIANALKAKVVALFGPTSDITWGPWRNPYARVLTKDFPCRPCYMDGCGGSKMADCLHTLEEDRVFQAVNQLLNSSISLIK